MSCRHSDHQEAGLNLVGLGWQVDDATRREVQDELAIAAIATLRQRAQAIAESIEMGVASINGVMLARGERLHRPELDAAVETSG